MKIVIDIPQRMYEKICNNTLGIEIFEAIKNGTPLPEHHGDLKDEREVVNILLKYAHSEQGKSFANFLVSEINDAPTIIEGSESE